MNLLEEHGLPWRDGIPGLISDLAGAGYRLAVASSGLERIIEYILETGGVRDHFEAVVSGDQITNPKPAPDIYLEAARRLGLNPSVCAAIEDTDVGVRACKAAGMYAIAFPCPTTQGQDFSPADTVIQEAAQICQVLRL
jgi:beta-phosphoglucomutase-like phosphatase (HAD superfamily)